MKTISAAFLFVFALTTLGVAFRIREVVEPKPVGVEPAKPDAAVHHHEEDTDEEDEEDLHSSLANEAFHHFKLP